MNQSESALSPVYMTSALLGGPRSIDERETKSGTRFETREVPALASREEVLIVDERSTLRPAQMVETKLSRLLSHSSLPVKLLMMRGLLRTR